MTCAIINYCKKQETVQPEHKQIKSQDHQRKILAITIFVISILLVIIGSLLLSFFPLTLPYICCSAVVIAGGTLTAVLEMALLCKCLFFQATSIQEKRIDVNDLKAEQSKLKEQALDLKQKISTLQLAKTSLEEQLNTNQTKIPLLQEELNKLKEELSRETKDTDLTSLQLKKVKLEASFEEINLIVVNLSIEVAKCSEKECELQRSKELISKKLLKTEEILKKLREDKTSLSKKIGKQSLLINSLNQEGSVFRKKLRRILKKKQLSEDLKSLDKRKMHNNDLRKNICMLEKNLQYLEADLEKETTNLINLKNQLEEQEKTPALEEPCSFQEIISNLQYTQCLSLIHQSIKKITELKLEMDQLELLATTINSELSISEGIECQFIQLEKELLLLTSLVSEGFSSIDPVQWKEVIQIMETNHQNNTQLLENEIKKTDLTQKSDINYINLKKDCQILKTKTNLFIGCLEAYTQISSATDQDKLPLYMTMHSPLPPLPKEKVNVESLKEQIRETEHLLSLIQSEIMKIDLELEESKTLFLVEPIEWQNKEEKLVDLRNKLENK